MQLFQVQLPLLESVGEYPGRSRKAARVHEEDIADHNPNVEASDVESMNDFLMDLTKLLGDDMEKLVDMSEWTRDEEILNYAIHQLSFRGCKFHMIVCKNVGGFGRDLETKPDIHES